VKGKIPMFSKKIDHKKLYSELYNPPTKQFSVVTVPPLYIRCAALRKLM
jgi:hypothetical protein